MTKKEFAEKNKANLNELTIFLDDKKHCVINDDAAASTIIELLSRLHAGKVLRVEKRGEK